MAIIGEEELEEGDAFCISTLDRITLLTDIILADSVKWQVLQRVRCKVFTVADHVQVGQAVLVGHGRSCHLLGRDGAWLLVRHL